MSEPTKAGMHGLRGIHDLRIGGKHLVDALGRGLPMPTPYDEFSERAHSNYRGCTPEEGHNRDLLKQAMVQEGFLPYIHEWWHFDDPEWERYPLLDLPFDGGPR